MELILHLTAHFEFDAALAGYLYALQGLGILSHTRSPRTGLEDSKVAEFQTIVRSQFNDDFIQKVLHYPLDHNPFGLGKLGNPVN